jgi:fatty-acyl-CoA synthase
VEGLMQDYELSLQHVLWRIERLHQKKEVVTKREQGVHRTTNGEMVPRINRLAGALKRLGIKPGERVATLAFNNYRHLELYYAVPCMGAVLHTLNLRLFPQHLEFIINDAEDKVLFVDQPLLPLLKPLLGKIPSIERVVLMTDDQAPSHSENGLADCPSGWPRPCATRPGRPATRKASSTRTAPSSSTPWARCRATVSA